MNNKNKIVLSSISSMTGFATVAGGEVGYNWTWEVKTVNGKSLDFRCRVPPGYEKVESKARTAVGKLFKRGNFTLSLTVQETASNNQYVINSTLLDQLIETATDLKAKLPSFVGPSIDGLLAVRGVIEPISKSEKNRDRWNLDKKILQSLDFVLNSLVENRIDEGARIGRVLFKQVKSINRLIKRAEKTVTLQPIKIRQKLKHQIHELMEVTPNLPEERIAQEAAIYMIKADVREELDRLSAHLQAAKDLMEEGGVIGRKLDFICQELNRETNTLCAKSSDIQLSKIGLELKAVIEQYREQVQNIE